MRDCEIVKAIYLEGCLHNLMESNSNSVSSNILNPPNSHLQINAVKEESHLKTLEVFVGSFNYR